MACDLQVVASARPYADAEPPRKSAFRSATAPKCCSLSGLTTEKISLTFPPAIFSISTLAIAPAGSNRFREHALSTPLRGGGNSVALDLAVDQCLQDVRIAFADGRRVIHRDVDLCRTRSLRIDRLPAETPARPAALARQ